MKYLNQHAIITGGSSGIGKAVARLLAEQGVNISLIARDRHKLEQAREEISTVTVATLGTPELLITSAGMAHPGYFSQIPLEIFEQTMAVNYFGTLYSIRAALPGMLERKKGRIVMISSGAGLIGIYGYSAYCPSKFALRGLAESLRGELKPQGIGVTIVYPPDTDTPQLAAENKIKPLETQKITATAKTWSAAAVAAEIVGGVAQNKFAIAPGTELTILNRFHSLLSPLLNKYFDAIINKTNK